ncbi:MAG TPA: insulinase family protein [Gemmatimonadales bacterium]|nr:insulinase family protein [Gemmatimonadales bacterium]
MNRRHGRPLLLAVACLTLASLPLAAQSGDSFPPHPPAPANLGKVRFPPFTESTLPNGMTLLVVENHSQPMLSVSLSFKAGSTRDPSGKEGLAELTAQILTKGSAQHTGNQIAALIEGVGGGLSAAAGADFFTVSTNVLSDHADVALGLLGEVTRTPALSTDELDLARTQALSALQLELSQPSSIAGRFFRQAIYGKNPYGRATSETSYKSITTGDVTGFAKRYLVPSGALLVMAGDVTPAQARAWATKIFGTWRGAPPPTPAAPAAGTAAPTEILLINRPGSVQANIVLGNTTYGPLDSSFYATRLAMQVLGGGADARLFLILREAKGWTYGSYAFMNRYRGLGYWQATFEGRTAVADSALAEMLHQVDRLRNETIPDSELAAGKGFLVGSFPLTIETSDQVAGAVSNAKLLGLGNNYVQTYRERLNAITSAQARAAASKALKRDHLTIVVVGDAQVLYDKLKLLAPVRLLDVDGKPITESDLNPRAGTLPIDPSQIVARRDSFVFMVQGRAFGTQISEIRKSGDSLVYDEALSMGPMGSQHTVVQFDPKSFGVRQVDQTGQVGGQASAIHLLYVANRVKGNVSVPQQTGTPKVFTVDTTVAADTYDDNALTLLVPTLPLTSGKSFHIGVFSSGDGETRVLTAKVGPADTVTVPAGKFTAYKVDISGGQAPVTFYVSNTAPRRVVRIDVVGQPVSLLLAK